MKDIRELHEAAATLTEMAMEFIGHCEVNPHEAKWILDVFAANMRLAAASEADK